MIKKIIITILLMLPQVLQAQVAVGGVDYAFLFHRCRRHR